MTRTGGPPFRLQIVDEGKRRGGIRGIIEKLDALQEFGVTAVWLSPV